MLFIQYFRDKRGSIAIPTALLLVILLGFAALALEVTGLFVQQRKMQAATDAAIMAAAVSGRTTAQALGDAVAIAGEYGFEQGSLGVKVSVNRVAPNVNYPLGATDVVLEKDFSPTLLRMFVSSPIALRARSVSITSRGSPGCLLALDTAGDGAVTIVAQSSILNSGCEIVSNSSSNQALVLESRANIAGPVFLVGNYLLGVNATITGTPLVVRGTPPVEDPYSSMLLPTAGTCTNQTASVNNNAIVTFNPGRFCDGLSVGRGATVSLNPGVYFFDNLLTIGNNAKIVGSRVSLILNNTPDFQLGNNVNLYLTAPLSGNTAGIAIGSQRNVIGNFTVNNGATLNILGAIYLPAMTAIISGNAKTAGQDCTQLIASRLILASNIQFKADCGATAVKPIGSVRPSLAE